MEKGQRKILHDMTSGNHDTPMFRSVDPKGEAPTPTPPQVLVDGEYVSVPVQGDPIDVFGVEPTFGPDGVVTAEAKQQATETARIRNLRKLAAAGIPPVLEWGPAQTHANDHSQGQPRI